MILRAGEDRDAEGFIALIGACWAEYPGCVMDVDGELPEVRALASSLRAKGGALWTAEASGQTVGMVATYPDPEEPSGTWAISRMYVARPQRGTGLADRLLDEAEAHATNAGATRLALWTDTRFERAHRFYERRSYVRSGPIRALNDRSHSIEFHYAKPLSGLERLDAAGAISAVAPLAEILRACVENGASISFLPPLAPGAARAFWHRAGTQVAAGHRIMLAAWDAGRIAGVVMLDLDTPPNQPHRAEVQKLLVHPRARRRGIARRLMAALEHEAVVARRTLLTLDTRAGDAAEQLYRAMGWAEAGAIPDFALDGAGVPYPTVIFYKRTAPRS